MTANSQSVAVVNAGSATLKFSFLQGEATVMTALLDRFGGAPGGGSQARLRAADGEVWFEGEIPAANHADGLVWLFQWLDRQRPGLRPQAVGHRVVHGGDSLVAPTRITPEVMARIEALIPLAPLHQPHNLAPIRWIAERFPELPQIACFDTAFHASQSPIERMFALPRDYGQRGIRRYGFHGLSYEYIAACLEELDPAVAAGRTVVCHLGNGASLCAMREGRSVATTMSFTALDGIPMGTRSGAVDPGVLLHFLEQERMPAAQLADLLYKRSGLLGISGISSDMRDLLDHPAPEAAEAVEYFCYRIAREIGSLAAALGGVDALVFTGGIGEHAAAVRARICDLSAWLGVAIDPAANESDQLRLERPDCRIRVLVIPTNEERIIARHTLGFLLGAAVAKMRDGRESRP